MVRASAAAAAALLALTLASCSGLPAERAEPAKPARPYLGTPKVGQCHDLTFDQLSAATETSRPVPCSSKHTTRTVAVVDAPKNLGTGASNAQGYAVGKACAAGYKKVVGGDSKARVTTLYSLAWFHPTKAQRAKGANWLRCDVTLTDQHRAHELTDKPPFLSDGASDDELRCGKVVRGESLSWEFVRCSDKHDFVTDKVLAADPGTSYKAAEKKAQQVCGGDLYSWSLPEQWGMGDRWYICWITVREDSENEVAT